MEISDACTLPTAEQPLRVAEFDRLFATSLRGVETVTATHARMRLAGGPGLAATVRDLTARESECCSFFSFKVTEAVTEGAATDGEAVTLDIEVPEPRAGVLASLVRSVA